MPEFIVSHVPADLDDFTRGYLGAFEWLLPEDEIDRDAITGWSADALTKIKADCTDFQAANASDLDLYCSLSGRDLDSAGHDFYLTRERHGAGFWDRGNDPVFKRLTEAAHFYGEAGYPCLIDGEICL
jgi:hypothetical protein